jgi:plasmid stabilization system protein ParE
MTEPFIVSPLAERDIAEAFGWYESRSAGLGEFFLRQLNDCFDSIRQRPLMFEIIVDDFRRALVRKFPYAVFFEHSADQSRGCCFPLFTRSGQVAIQASRRPVTSRFAAIDAYTC